MDEVRKLRNVLEFKGMLCANVDKRREEWIFKLYIIILCWFDSTLIGSNLDNNIVNRIVNMDVRTCTTAWHKENAYHQYLLSILGCLNEVQAQCEEVENIKQIASAREAKYRKRCGYPRTVDLCHLISPIKEDNYFSQGGHWILYGQICSDEVMRLWQHQLQLQYHMTVATTCSDEDMFYMSMQMKCLKDCLQIVYSDIDIWESDSDSDSETCLGHSRLMRLLMKHVDYELAEIVFSFLYYDVLCYFDDFVVWDDVENEHICDEEYFFTVLSYP